jgi:hypothetical protein
VVYMSTTHNTDRFITLDTIFGRRWLPVRISHVFDFDGNLVAVEGTALEDVPSEYIARGDRLSVTEDNLVPLIVRVNPALVG